MPDIELLKKEFGDICKTWLKRPGADELLKWLEDNDFFTAPASSKYHLAIPGGLLQHSLNVYRSLHDLLIFRYGPDLPYTMESIAIVALLHDICKVNMYKPTQRNQKTYDKTKVEAADKNQIKHDGMGDYIWETVQSYEIKEDFIFGHGEKSVYLINKFMKLTDVEAQAIRYHMSSWKHDDVQSVGKVYAANPLAFFLHVADEMATYLDEADD
jgi:HD superfamily phosphohydrolase YqeK